MDPTPTMDTGFSAMLPSIRASKKSAARVALIDLKETHSAILMDCFRQFGIHSVALLGNAAQRLHREKFRKKS